MVRSAVLLPGARFGPHTPTLAYPRFAAEDRGAEIVELEWPAPDAGLIPESEREAWVTAAVDPVLESAPHPLLLGRSLGAYAAGRAADLGLPAIWINPVLTSVSIAAALRRASAPVLLVGGTADALWDGALARAVTPHVLEIEGANHGLMVPGSLTASAEALGRLATAAERFLDALGLDDWPG